MDGSAARLAELRTAIAADPHPSHRVAHAATVLLIARAEGAGSGRLLLGWEHFPEAAAQLVGEVGWPMTVAVMANVISVVDFAEPVDFLTLNRS